MTLSKFLKMIHDSGEYGMMLEGLSENARQLEQEVEELRHELNIIKQSCPDEYTVEGSVAGTAQNYIVNLEMENTRLESYIEGLFETFIAIADMLNIDPEKARKEKGKPSEVYRRHLAKHDAEVIKGFIEGVSDKYGYSIKGWNTYWVVDVEDMKNHAKGLYQQTKQEIENEK